MPSATRVLAVALTAVLATLGMQARASAASFISLGAGAYPYGVGLGGDSLFVADYGTNTVHQVDLATSTVVRTYPQPASSYPYDVAATPSELVVIRSGQDAVVFVDRSSGAVAGTVPTGDFPFSVTLSGNRAYVPMVYGLGVAVIDLTTRSLVTTISTGTAFNYDVAIVGTTGFVTERGSDSVAVFDTATNAVTGRIPVGRGPFGIATDGTSLFVVNSYDRTVSIIDAASRTVTSTVPLDMTGEPLDVEVSDGTVVVANSSGTSMTGFTVGSTADTTLTIGRTTNFIAISGGMVYATNPSNESVAVESLSAFASPPANDAGGPPEVLQQVGRNAAGPCDRYASDDTANWAGVGSGGWSESWSPWMHGGAGGPVCTRTLGYSQGRWIVR